MVATATIATMTVGPQSERLGFSPERVDTDNEEDNPNSAVAVLRTQMLFYRDQAETLCEKIIDALKANNARGDLIAMMYKYANEAKKMAIDCANKLAPYESPKLQAIEVKNTTVTKFVIEAPTLATDQNSWLENVRNEQKMITKVKNNIDIEDAEIINGNA